MATKESDSSLSYLNDPDAESPLRSLLLRLKSELQFGESIRLWAAPLAPANSRLERFMRLQDPKIQQVEIYHDTDKPELQSVRIYFTHQETYIPTMVIGNLIPIGRASHADMQSINPLNGHNNIRVADSISVAYPDDLFTIPFVADVLRATSYPYYLIRPSSFMLETCTEVDHRMIVEQYKNQLSGQKDERFMIVSPLLGRALVSNFGTNRLLITNSPDYVNRHPKWQFEDMDCLLVRCKEYGTI